LVGAYLNDGFSRDKPWKWRCLRSFDLRPPEK
jgi:hypothetical protein